MLTGNQELKQLTMMPVEKYFCWVLWKKSILSPPGKKLDSSLPCSTSNAWGYSCIIFTCCKNQCTSHQLSIKLQLLFCIAHSQGPRLQIDHIVFPSKQSETLFSSFVLGREKKKKQKERKPTWQTLPIPIFNKKLQTLTVIWDWMGLKDHPGRDIFLNTTKQTSCKHPNRSLLSPDTQ